MSCYGCGEGGVVQEDQEVRSVLDALYLCSGSSLHDRGDAHLGVRHIQTGLRKRTR